MMKTARRPTRGPIAGVQQTHVELRHTSFGQYRAAESWAPAMNVYHLPGRLAVCVDLAGVTREQIEVQLAPGKLSVAGRRTAPEPARADDEPMRIFTMEIDHGRFCRTLALPMHVDLDRATSEYRDGMLWITLPLREA